MKETHKLMLACGGIAWTSLGMYRGGQEYNRKYNKDLQRHLKDPIYYDKPKYYYTSLIGNSIGSGFFYIISAPFIFINKEVYKFEDFIRGRENNE
jgi:hypothetical protein